jgi:magnesium transporter
MKNRIRRAFRKAGTSPGTLVHVGEPSIEKVRIQLVRYSKPRSEEQDDVPIDHCFPLRKRPTVTWINVQGVHQIDIVQSVGDHLSLHPLVLEDIVNTGQRPKIEDYDEYLFIVMKILQYDEVQQELRTEQLSLILGSNYVVSLQEKTSDLVKPIRDRIKNLKGRHHSMGADYLAYSLIDAVVDSYFVVLEQIGDVIEEIEQSVISDPEPETLQTIHRLKREMVFVRKSVWPLREVISGLQRTESALIRERTGIYLRDVYDHTIQVIDTVESFRDMVSGMLDTYLSSISNRMNEVMKVLTLIATIFIPLTFFAGVYGMNFEGMPELHWHWFYPAGFWIAIVLIVGFMTLFFKRKKWL